MGLMDKKRPPSEAVDMSDELRELRESLRSHWGLLAEHGRDPLEGTSWGPDFDRYVGLLDVLARESDAFEVPSLPWTSRTLADVDERCRVAGLLNGEPLLPLPA